jgi:hypothetical protein
VALGDQSPNSGASLAECPLAEGPLAEGPSPSIRPLTPSPPPGARRRRQNLVTKEQGNSVIVTRVFLEDLSRTSDETLYLGTRLYVASHDLLNPRITERRS